MKIYFYGTGSSEGFPALFCECEYCRTARKIGGKNIRTRSSAQIDESLLIDFSPDTYAHEVYGGLDLTKIKYLLVTHSHTDHFYAADIEGIFPPMAETSPERKLEVYGNEEIGKLLKDTLQKGYESKVDFHRTESFYPFQIEQYTVMPLRANHMQSEECHLYIISRDGRTVLYGQDSAMFPEETWEELKLWKFSCVILDCTSVDRDNYFDCHMGIQDNARIKERMIKEGMADEDTKFIATHFAHTFAPYHERLTELFRPYGIIPAYDGMEIEI